MKNRTAEMLKEVELFSGLEDEQLLSILSLAEEKTFPKGVEIIREDEPEGSALFAILEGSAAVSVTSADGKETILSLLTAGDFFGEMSLIDGEPRSASVRTASPSRVLMIRREAFHSLLRKMPELSLALLHQLSQRLRKANKQISSLATLSILGRIAGVMLSLVEEQGIRTPIAQGRTVVVVRSFPSRQMIAEMSGTSRESVSRAISEWRRRGAIAFRNRDLVVLNEEQLKSEV